MCITLCSTQSILNMSKQLLLASIILNCLLYSAAEEYSIRSASFVTLYKPGLYGVNAVADVSGDWMITANASSTEGNAFILKRNNITFNWEAVYIYPSQIRAVTTNGRWFAASDMQSSTTVFQLDRNYSMANSQQIQLSGKFIKLQQNDVLILVDDGYINSYEPNEQGQWQLVSSLPVASSVYRADFLEDKFVLSFLDNSDQYYRFYQRNGTSWYQFDEFFFNSGYSRWLVWNGDDTLFIFNQIWVKQGSQWSIQSFVAASSDYIRNGAFIDENSLITNEFRQNNSATIFTRANSSQPWAPSGLVLDNLQRTNVEPLFQYFVTGGRVVVFSLDASSAPTRVLIDEIAEQCTSENTVIGCNTQLDTCRNVTIVEYFTINRPCQLTIDPKPYHVRLENVFGKIILGSFNFSGLNGFHHSCDAVIQCPELDSPSTTSTSPSSSSSSPSSSSVPVSNSPSHLPVTSSSVTHKWSVASSLILLLVLMVMQDLY